MTTVRSQPVRVMSQQEFITMPARTLERNTSIPASRWSEWQRGRKFGERSLVEISQRLGISPGTFLDWMLERRKVYPQTWEQTRAKYKQEEEL